MIARPTAAVLERAAPLGLCAPGRGAREADGNAFGERIVPADVERAVVVACRRAHAEVVAFTVAPRHPTAEEPRGGHDWLVEFAEPPRCPLDVFTQALDETLMAVNSGYRALRAPGGGMVGPRLVELPAGTFCRWMRGHGSPGTPPEVPRLAKDRAVADRLLAASATLCR